MFSAALLAIACLVLVTLYAVHRARGVARHVLPGLGIAAGAGAVSLLLPPEYQFLGLIGLVGSTLTTEQLTQLEAEAKKLPALREQLDAAIKRADEAAGRWGQGPEARIKGLEQELTAAKQARDELEKRFGARIDEFETRMNRPGAAGALAEKTKEDALALKAFGQYLRKGHVDASLATELKTLATNDGANGGFLMPAPLVARMVEELVQVSPIRQHSAPLTITQGDALEVPRDEGAFSVEWVGETQARAETNHSTFAKLLVQTREMSALAKVTQKMLDDVPDIESYVTRKTGQAFGKEEGKQFLLGDNVKQPEGLLTNADITTVKTASAAAVTADGLLDLIAALPTEYTPQAKLFMNRKTAFAIRKLKDSQNRYLWEPGLPSGSATPGSGLTQMNAPTFAGVPIVETPDMADVAAASKSILYTDWRLSYQIVDKPGIGVLRDPFTSKPNVLFYTTRRVGGRVVNPKAAKIQKTEA